MPGIQEDGDQASPVGFADGAVSAIQDPATVEAGAQGTGAQEQLGTDDLPENRNNYVRYAYTIY